MANMLEVNTSQRKALVQDLGTYLLSEDIAPLIGRLQKSSMNEKVAKMSPEELKEHYGTDEPTDEQILADMEIDYSAFGELAFKAIPIGVVEPKIRLGFLNEDEELGKCLKWKDTGDVVSVADTKVLFEGIAEVSGLNKDAGSSFRGSLCHTAE